MHWLPISTTKGSTNWKRQCGPQNSQHWLPPCSPAQDSILAGDKLYNRYIPKPDGTYHRNRVSDPDPPRSQHPASSPTANHPQQCSQQPVCNNATPSRQNDSIMGFLKNLLPKNMDTGDLIIVLLLLLMANDCEQDRNHALLTLALYFFL